MTSADDSRGVLVSDLRREDGPYVPPEMLTKDIPMPWDNLVLAPRVGGVIEVQPGTIGNEWIAEVQPGTIGNLGLRAAGHELMEARFPQRWARRVRRG